MLDNLETIDELAARWKVKKPWVYKQTMKKDADSIPRINVGKYIRFVPEKVDAWLLNRQNPSE